MADIKETIRDFLKFDIENDYYDEAKKEEIANMFKEILFEDETTVRQFLKAMFDSSETLAQQYGLVAPEGEVIEEPIAGGAEVEEIGAEENEDAVEEPEDAEEMEDAVEEPEDAEEMEDAVEEAKKFYRGAAANILYD